MSKSLDFCRARASNPSLSFYADRDWNKAIEDMETEAIFDEFLHGARNFHLEGRVDGDIEISFDVSISFDSNADFDYFTSDSCVHDGTLLFVRDVMDRCVRKVCNAKTYNKSIGEPESGDSIQFIVGNFVVLNEYDGDFVPVNKPWLRERTTVLLPIKMIKD